MQAFEGVFVRHCVPSKRGKFDHIAPLIHSGLDSCSSSSAVGLVALNVTAPSDRWTVAIQWSGSDWVPLCSNAASPAELYQANIESRRSQALWVRQAEHGDCELKWVSARKVIVEFSHHADQPEAWQGHQCSDASIAKALEHAIAQSATGDQAFRTLCEHAQIKLPMPTLRIVENKYCFLDSDGESLEGEVRNFVCFKAFGMAVGASPASDRLADAIEEGDLEGVKRAIADGVSLDKLPDSSCSPLETAIYKCGDTDQWRQCAQALVDAGCSVNGDSGEPLIFTACEHFVHEPMSIEMMKFLLENHADINALNQSGETVLHRSAVYRRAEVTEFLMKNGARTDIKTRGEDTIVDEIRRRVEESAEYGKRSDYADILELLTGQVYELPAEYQPSPSVVAEARRFIQIANAKHLRSQLPASPEVQQIKTSRLSGFDSFKEYVRELKACGFEESCHLVVRVATMPVMQSVYTNEKLRCDAIFGDDGRIGDGQLRMEICSYSVDGQILSVANKPAQDLGEFRPSIIENHLFANATPKMLIEHLKAVVSGRVLATVDRKSAPDRYVAMLKNVFDSIKERTKEIEREKWVRDDGTVPRFERLKVYLQVRPGSDPSDCYTHNISRCCLKDIEAYRNGNAKGREERDVIRKTAELMAIAHLEFAGAVHDLTAVDVAANAALTLFERWKKRKDTDADGITEPLSFAFSIMAVHGRWDETQRLSAMLTDSLFDTPEYDSDNPPHAYAFLMGMIANLYRKKPLRTNSELYRCIEETSDKRAIALAKAVVAIENENEIDFSNSISEAIKLAVKRKPRRDWFFDFDRLVAWHETLVWHIAKNKAMSMPNLKTTLSDWVIQQDICSPASQSL